jgi:GT2 family glycosyltransferase
VIIVDDGSTDGTSESICECFPDVELIVADGTLWFTEGTNVGIRRALTRNPKYILLINDDQVFDADFLIYMVETAERHPRSVIGSLLLLWNTPHRLFQVSPIWDTWAGGWRHWYSQTVWTVPESSWKVDLIVGNCVLIPAEAFRNHGLMNSARYPNFGDAEFTPRLRKDGWTLLIDPRARVFCQPNAPPPRVRTLGWRRMISDLFLDLRSNHNLRRRLYADLDGGPTMLKGLTAFIVFLIRAAIGNSPETGSWAAKEEPLRKTFAAAVVDE